MLTTGEQGRRSRWPCWTRPTPRATATPRSLRSTRRGHAPGHPGQRARPARTWSSCSSRPSGTGRRRLHPRRDAAGARLPGVQEIPPPSSATTATPGGTRTRSSSRSTARSSSPPTASCPAARRPTSTRIFTTGAAGYPGVTHIPDRTWTAKKDFSALIALAKTLPAAGRARGGRRSTIGFAHQQVLALADKVIDAVKSGAIKRSWSWPAATAARRAANTTPTSPRACPRTRSSSPPAAPSIRYNKLNLGDIGGIPRVLDAGQCNDCLLAGRDRAEAAGRLRPGGLNELPHRVQHRLVRAEGRARAAGAAVPGREEHPPGPTLPAFLSPNVAKVLVEKFGIAASARSRTTFGAPGRRDVRAGHGHPPRAPGGSPHRAKSHPEKRTLFDHFHLLAGERAAPDFSDRRFHFSDSDACERSTSCRSSPAPRPDDWAPSTGMSLSGRARDALSSR